MAELFIELFSEEIPARLQKGGADELARLVDDALAALKPAGARSFYGPRRIALAVEVADSVPAVAGSERGPRVGALAPALAGFCRKHGAEPDALRQEGGFWVLDTVSGAVAAATLIGQSMPGLLRRFAWPKSMRWGGTSAFTWIRPLRRIVCLLGGEVVGFTLAQGEDDGHGLAAGRATEGHRMHGPCVFDVSGVDDWADKLFTHRVMVRGRVAAVRDGMARLAAEQGLAVVEDAGLLDEVAGLVEWPVPLLGRIDQRFMDLPAEVMRVSMRVNQRYFATCTADGRTAPYFAFAANLEAPDGGAAIIAGNERVLRARFADARHFWELDRRTRLADRVADLDRITFQAELGSQGARVRRIVRLAGVIAPMIGADVTLAERAALLAKADLTTGMVGEFPELQGIMGGYYARHDGEDERVASAVRDHYSPKGSGDGVPFERVTVAVALADKLDQLVAFFAIGERPTGSGDPFALRRAALGVIRIVREVESQHGAPAEATPLRIALLPVLRTAADGLTAEPDAVAREVLSFIVDRLRVQLRAEGARHDVLSAVFATGDEDDVARALARTEALAALLKTGDGANLLAAYKRAANILRIEDRKDGPHGPGADAALFQLDAERDLHAAMAIAAEADLLLQREDFGAAMSALAQLRSPLDAFFEGVTVNAEVPELRLNRLRLLSELRASLNRVADFSAIES